MIMVILLMDLDHMMIEKTMIFYILMILIRVSLLLQKMINLEMNV